MMFPDSAFRSCLSGKSQVAKQKIKGGTKLLLVKPSAAHYSEEREKAGGRPYPPVRFMPGNDGSSQPGNCPVLC
jgi:hypothetical protein